MTKLEKRYRSFARRRFSRIVRESIQHNRWYFAAAILSAVLYALVAASTAKAYTPNTDITEELQAACNAYSKTKQPIVLPPGEFWIGDTIKLPTVFGFEMTGEGVKRPGTIAKAVDGTGTILEWRGPADKPMFDFSASRGRIGNFTIVSKLGGTAILVNKRLSGMGVGKVFFEPMQIEGFDCGIQVGRKQTESNCDNLFFNWLYFRNCKLGYHGVNAQGVDIVFDYIHAYRNVPQVLKFDGGGHVIVNAGLVTATDSTFLTINDTRAKSIGKNNGFFRLNNIQIDAQAGLTHQLIDCREPYGILLIVDGVNRAQKGWEFPTAPLAEVCGKNLLTICNARGNHEIIGTEGRDSTPCVSISDSQFWGLRHSGADVRITNCQAVTGEWLDGETIKRGDTVEIK